MKYKNIIVLFWVILLTSCSSLINGKWQKVNISATQANTQIFINGRDYGMAPLSLKMRNNDTYLISAESQGFQSSQVRLIRKPSKWILLNFTWLYFAPSAFLTDVLIGGVFKLHSDEKSKPKKLEGTKTQSNVPMEKSNAQYKNRKLNVHFDLGSGSTETKDQGTN